MITMITMIGLQVHMSRKHAMIEQLDGNISLPHDVGMPLEDQFNEDTVRQWSYFTLVLFSNGVCLYTAYLSTILLGTICWPSFSQNPNNFIAIAIV